MSADVKSPRPTTDKNGVGDAGFDQTKPTSVFAPKMHNVVRQKTREHLATGTAPHRRYDELTAMIRVGLRAEKGPLEGKPFLGVVDGEQFPDEVDSQDRTTWLQPGTYMDVPKHVAYHLFGNVWDPDLPDRRDIINKYGGPQYKPLPGGSLSGRGAPMVVVGLPKIPDVMLAEVDRRGRLKTNDNDEPEWRSVFELYTRGMVIGGKDIEGGDPDNED